MYCIHHVHIKPILASARPSVSLRRWAPIAAPLAWPRREGGAEQLQGSRLMDWFSFPERNL